MTGRSVCPLCVHEDDHELRAEMEACGRTEPE